MIAPAFRYYGSKATMAQWIVDLMPAHSAYVEPFAGSAAVLLRKPRSTKEVLNDWDDDVMNFWRVLRDYPAGLIEVLQLTPYGRAEHSMARRREPMDPIEQARRFYAATCLSFNGSGTGGYSAGNLYSGAQPATFHRRIDQRLSLVADRLRLVELENIDALSLIDRWDDSRTLMYVDPPYLGSVRSAQNQYAKDNGSIGFHERLIARLKTFKGNVILSGYSSPLYSDLLSSWTVRTKPGVAKSSGRERPTTEVVWLNYGPKSEVPE